MFWVREIFGRVDFSDMEFGDVDLSWPGTVASNVCDPDRACKHSGFSAVSAGDLLWGDGPFAHEANQYLHPPDPRRS